MLTSMVDYLPKMLLLDIETSPSTAYTFDMWQTNISAEKLIEPSYILCWAAKWYGKKKMYFRSLHHDGHKKMLVDIHKLVDEADILIHYNGKRFDVPHLKREWLIDGLTPPSPYKQIDLYHTIRSQFKFTHNSLGNVCRQLGLETKITHEGFDLWPKCMRGDKDAWAAMKEYNINDVAIMEPLYEKLRPWVPSHPSVAALAGENVCPACGSHNLIRKGTTVTTVGRFATMQCADCGKWSRVTRRELGVGVTAIPY
jgi:DNA polymerase elongation subunit (family B)